MELIVSWAKIASVDLPAVRAKFRFVGITWQHKCSPNVFRWHQHAAWLKNFPSNRVKNVSIPGTFWSYLGNTQAKVGWWNPPSRWADSKLKEQPRRKKNLSALCFAREVFEYATTGAERKRFADELRKQPQMNEAWFRGLVTRIRRKRSVSAEVEKKKQ